MTDIQTSPKKSASSSLTFLLYGIYFLVLWAIYFASTTIYMHFVEDLTQSDGKDWIRHMVQYGHGAALLIMATVAFFANRFFVAKSFASGQLTYDTGSRSWVLRITVLFAGILAAIDIYELIVSIFLGRGELGQLNNVLITLVAALGVIGFCMSELSKKDNQPNPLWTPRTILFLVFSIITIGIALYQESPAKVRLILKDKQQLDVLYGTAQEINKYYQKHKILPKKLEDLPADPKTYKDLQTQNSFVYKALEKDTYELCAQFKTNKRDAKRHYMRYDSGDFDYTVGESCLKQKLYLQ